MATPQSLAETVKAAILGGTATASTVTTLQTVLGGTPTPEVKANPTARTGRPIVTTSTTAKQKRVTVTTGKPTTTKRPPVKVLEDEPRSLSPKARYALATEVINITLKVLSSATKSTAKVERQTSSGGVNVHDAAPRKPSQPPSNAARALQIRSGNATPISGSPTKAQVACKSTNWSESATSLDYSAVGECSRVAFSYLRSTDTNQLGVKPLPQFQLENGMLALAGRLIALDHVALAVKELLAVNTRLEKLKGDRVKGRDSGKMVEEKSLAGLLVIDLDFEKHRDALPVAISYHSHVLQAIASSLKPGVVGHCVQHLELERPYSPGALIIQNLKASGDLAKAIRQLESLRSVILRLCSGVSSNADEEAAASFRLHESPFAVFRLQTIALQIRRETWQLAKHKVDVENDIAGPLCKALTALVRRSPPGNFNAEVCKTCAQVCSAFDTAGWSDSTKQTIYKLLSILAERAGLWPEAAMYAAKLLEACASLEWSHARHLAALGRSSSVMLGRDSNESLDRVCSNLRTIDKNVCQSLSGSAADYEGLLSELAHLVSVLDRNTQTELETYRHSVARAAGGFASRFAKSMPGKQTRVVADLITLALFHSKTSEELTSWVKKETVEALMRLGLMKIVCERAQSRPMASAWSGSAPVLALRKALQALMLRAISSDRTSCLLCVADDEHWATNERGAILEWQLMCAVEMAHKKKYEDTLAILTSEILERLLNLYTPAKHPIRRARVAAIAFRLCEENPAFVTSGILIDLQTAADIDVNNLDQDGALAAYVPDIKATLRLSSELTEGNRTREQLSVCLRAWQLLLDSANDGKQLESIVADPQALLLQLTRLEEYFEMLGDDEARLWVARMICQLNVLWTADSAQWCIGLVHSARAHLALGFVERASEALSNAQQLLAADDTPNLNALEYHICHAEYLLAMDMNDECLAALQTTAKSRLKLEPRLGRSQESKSYKLIHGRGWLTHSKYLLATGDVTGSLKAAKRAVKVMNSIWCGIERSARAIRPNLTESGTRSSPEPEVEALSRGVSKLNLKPESTTRVSSLEASTSGPAFWPIVRLICDALMHLADVFVRHGVFNEANYSLERSISIAEAAGSFELLCRLRYRRTVLLTSAGRTEEAQLCLAKDQDSHTTLSALTKVEQLRAKAALASKQNDFQSSYKSLEQAEAILNSAQTESYLSSIERISNGNPKPVAQSASQSKSVRTKIAPVKANNQPAPKKGILKNSRTTGSSASVKVRPSGSFNSDYVLQKLGAQVKLQKAFVSFHLENDSNVQSWEGVEACGISSLDFDRQRLQHLIAMRKVANVLQADFSFNVLPESTLSFPALQGTNRELSAALPLQEVKRTSKTAGRPTKGVKTMEKSEDDLEQLLLHATRCLSVDSAAASALGTADTHKLHSLQFNASLVLAFTSAARAADVLHPTKEAFSLDWSRMYAAHRNSIVAKLEVDFQQPADLLLWPEPELTPKHLLPTAQLFRNDYIDILPTPWTAVSLSLNEDADELYIARYKRGQMPFLLRLPFSRQRSEDTNEEVFDFHVGREELQEIVQLSNYSCHNSMDTSIKGAKTNWWSEREALDRRLQELLLNIENIWLGGFKGVFSQHQRDDQQLSRFRKTFETVLDRHLPSRRAAKNPSKKLVLDDQVLELFIGLGSDNNGDVDLDEPLADLLYFVVDVLQFNGERNAYDEVDFDSMAIEVLDGLRDYHDAVGRVEDAHLILVLDRRLQAFPWESLPCLENASVSRVDSMTTLRDRIVEMHSRSPKDAEMGQYAVSRAKGTYILNPSSDLKGTETMLQPELSKLDTASGGQWTSIVRREPTEDEFKTELSNSSTLLYFGHGAGSQYIRPRTIRKMERCSEVVWLMGCSSGAVTENDELEPFTVPLAYMVAGKSQHYEADIPPTSSGKCMAVVATLWDVTDKDIDRFSLAVGQEWGLWSAPEQSTKISAKTPRKGNTRVQVPSTPEARTKTPKTPRAKKTPAAAKTPARSRSRARSAGERAEGNCSLVEAVSRSREACYLRYLNGAAPVVYGVPVYLGN